MWYNDVTLGPHTFNQQISFIHLPLQQFAVGQITCWWGIMGKAASILGAGIGGGRFDLQVGKQTGDDNTTGDICWCCFKKTFHIMWHRKLIWYKTVYLTMKSWLQRNKHWVGVNTTARGGGRGSKVRAHCVSEPHGQEITDFTCWKSCTENRLRSEEELDSAEPLIFITWRVCSDETQCGQHSSPHWVYQISSDSFRQETICSSSIFHF